MCRFPAAEFPLLSLFKFYLQVLPTFREHSPIKEFHVTLFLSGQPAIPASILPKLEMLHKLVGPNEWFNKLWTT